MFKEKRLKMTSLLQNSEPQETICNTEEQPASPRNVLQNESEPVQQCSISSVRPFLKVCLKIGKMSFLIAPFKSLKHVILFLEFVIV